MISTPPHRPKPLVTGIENLACSCFCKIAAFFAKLEHCVRLSGQLVTQSARYNGSAAFKRRMAAENDQLNNPVAMSRKVKGVYERSGSPVMWWREEYSRN
jgi:hypothetical protein